MNRWQTALAIASVTGVLLALGGGCGGSGSSPLAGDVSRAVSIGLPQVLPMWTVEEYRGEGAGAYKQMPSFVRVQKDVSSQFQPPKLRFRAPSRAGQTERANFDWYYIQPLNTDLRLVIMVQPTANEDSDLYVFEGTGSDFDDDANCLAYSRRLPTLNQGPDSLGGYAPDWVAIDFTDTNGYPAAQVGVYGYENWGVSEYHYRIEVDKIRWISVNGPWYHSKVAYQQSDWWAFWGTTGNHYVVRTVSPGNPDMYVYEQHSSGFIDDEEGPAGGIVEFDADYSGWHYVRVFGAKTTPGPSHYEIKVIIQNP